MPTNNYNLEPSATPKIGFKLGLQATMDTMLGNNTKAQDQRSGVHGTFYLTSDTHRLYVGNSDNTISPVNQGVITVSTIDDLPDMNTITAREIHEGQFYYISTNPANVLCVYSGGRWVQINSVTHVETFGNTVVTSSGKATITHSLTQTGGATALTSILSLTGAGGATVSSTGSDITITGNTSSVAAASTDGGVNAAINLTNSNSTDASSVKLVKGSNVTLGVSGNNITIGATNTVVNAVTGDNAGASANGFKVTVSSNDGSSRSGTIDPIISYGENSNHSEHFVGGTAVLDVYTTDEVDDKITAALRTFDAMVYKGTTTGGSALPTANVQNGDTYILESAYTDANTSTTYPAGSLVIATGTENASTGYLPTPINWKYVDASGRDTTYTATATTHGMEWSPSTGGIMGRLSFVAGTAITLTDSASTGNTQAITITHSNVSRSDTTATWVNNTAGSKNVAVVTGVTTNAQGHVTGVEVTTLTLTFSHSYFDTPVSKISAAAGALVSLTNSTSGDVTSTAVETVYEIKDPAGNRSQAAGAFSIASETLRVFGNGQQVGINLLWGSF